MCVWANQKVSVVAIGTSVGHLVCVAIAVTAGSYLASRLSVKHGAFAADSYFWRCSTLSHLWPSFGS